MAAAGFFINLGVRIAALVAIWQNWGWTWAVAALLALMFIRAPKTSWRTIKGNSGMTYVRVILEVAILIAGLIATNVVWGAIWAAVMLIIYVIGFVASCA